MIPGKYSYNTAHIPGARVRPMVHVQFLQFLVPSSTNFVIMLGFFFLICLIGPLVTQGRHSYGSGHKTESDEEASTSFIGVRPQDLNNEYGHIQNAGGIVNGPGGLHQTSPELQQWFDRYLSEPDSPELDEQTNILQEEIEQSLAAAPRPLEPPAPADEEEQDFPDAPLHTEHAEVVVPPLVHDFQVLIQWAKAFDVLRSPTHMTLITSSRKGMVLMILTFNDPTMTLNRLLQIFPESQRTNMGSVVNVDPRYLAVSAVVHAEGQTVSFSGVTEFRNPRNLLLNPNVVVHVLARLDYDEENSRIVTSGSVTNLIGQYRRELAVCRELLRNNVMQSTVPRTLPAPIIHDEARRKRNVRGVIPPSGAKLISTLGEIDCRPNTNCMRAWTEWVTPGPCGPAYSPTLDMSRYRHEPFGHGTYDPVEQARGRVDQLKSLGYSVDMVEYIIMEGTFMSLLDSYREDFIPKLYNALSGYQTSKVDEAVEWTYRNIGCRDVCLAKDAGFKVISHVMPDLPNISLERNVDQFREYFKNPAFRTDRLKIYPALMIRGTGLYELWRTGLRIDNDRTIP
ncbi:hypothetical protein DCS_05888 [Drechmeria coniospora]|uniref:Uncharacterized protein n=1 Tax=Drechmeria coniospora TaxID=98403 RepID=A0A151GP58_DRECN|nr:hypothetical protein DCS_05888 [Drechmeria coniospora]KYK58870.1 hypothetical protein DCS_05888 [Drechmeria coniospora]